MPIISDELQIQTADELLADGYITPETRALLVTDGPNVVDDTQFPVDICENGDVYVYGSGAYPLILRNYLTITEKES